MKSYKIEFAVREKFTAAVVWKKEFSCKYVTDITLDKLDIIFCEVCKLQNIEKELHEIYVRIYPIIK